MRSHSSLGVALTAALLTLSAAGCGTSPPAPASATGSPPLPLTRPTPPATAHMGAGCGLFPAHGSGSFGGISKMRAFTAASRNPHLSVFSSAIRTAALSVKLNSLRSFTLFIPVNSAFAALSRPQLRFLRENDNLVKMVRYHVVPHTVTPAEIVRGGSVATLSGAKLTLARRGGEYRINQATVLCGNIRTANGTLYVIDKVLLPAK